MLITPTNDKALIMSVLSAPGICEHICEGDASLDEVPEAQYLAGWADDECVGVVMMCPISSRLFDVHIHCLPEHRKLHAFDFGMSAINWIWQNTNCQKMVAQIPFCNENVLKFALLVGFKVEGINRKSWLKNGVLNDSWYVGLVRGE